MKEHHEECLVALNDVTQPCGELCVPFRVIEKKLNLDRSTVRRYIRFLARKGLAEFHSPLMTEDGDFAGAGYCVSEEGREWIESNSHNRMVFV